MRMGSMKRPFYRLVVVDSRTRRDGRCIENLGTYNPLPAETEVTLQEDRILHWLGQGAQMSGTAEDLVRQAGLLERFQLLKAGTPHEELEAKLAEWKARQPRVSGGRLSRADKKAQKKADARAAVEAEKAAAAAPADEAPADEAPAAPAVDGEDAEKAEG
jgi:small subunit ribosomal protein S16